LQLIVHAHGDDVHAGDEVLGDVVGETDIAVRPPAEVDAVDPDIAVHVDAVELEPRLAPRRARRQPECFAIPTDPRREVATASASACVLTGRPFDAPI